MVLINSVYCAYKNCSDIMGSLTACSDEDLRTHVFHPGVSVREEEDCQFTLKSN